jgi:uncharacterized protein YecE (DUF72 family)
VAEVHVGTSGWSYDHWDGVLYPPGTPPADRLRHYVQRFQTVELNASFYRWPRESAFASWRRRLPAGFQLSVKAPRGLTHAKRLYAPEVWIQRISSSTDSHRGYAWLSSFGTPAGTTRRCSRTSNNVARRTAS